MSLPGLDGYVKSPPTQVEPGRADQASARFLALKGRGAVRAAQAVALPRNRLATLAERDVTASGILKVEWWYR